MRVACCCQRVMRSKSVNSSLSTTILSKEGKRMSKIAAGDVQEHLVRHARLEGIREVPVSEEQLSGDDLARFS